MRMCMGQVEKGESEAKLISIEVNLKSLMDSQVVHKFIFIISTCFCLTREHRESPSRICNK